MSIRKAYFNLTLRQFIKLNQIPKEQWLERLLFVYPKAKSESVVLAGSLYEELVEAENELPKTKLSKFYRVGWNWYYLNTKLSAVRADQFIDLAHFAGQEEPTEEIHNILAVFLIPVKSFFGEWLYNGSVHKEVATDLLNMKLKDATPIMVFFLQLFREIIGGYPNLFSGKSGEVKPFYKKWGWIATINNLAGGDKTKWNYFYSMGVLEFLNLVTFQLDEADGL